MDNGDEVVAELPNPNEGHAFYATASEVATRDFVCSSSTMTLLFFFFSQFVAWMVTNWVYI